MSLPRYPEYKDSGTEALGVVPVSWAVQRFDAYTTTHRESVTPEQLDGQSVLHFSIPSIQETGYGTIEDGASIDSNKLVVSSLQLLVSKLNPHKQVVVLASPHGKLMTVASTEFVPLIPMAANSKYIHYVWQSPICLHYLLARCDSATRSHQRVSPDDITKMFWAWPGEDEQAAIAAFLDKETAKIDALIAEQEKLLALLAEKRRATISHAVTRGLDPDAPMKDSGVPWVGKVPAHWRVTKCGRFLSILSGFAFPSSGFDPSGNGTRLLRGVNVAVSTLRWEDVVYWERAPRDGLDDYELKSGDLVIGMDRPLIAAGVRVAKVTEGDVPCLLLQRVASLRTACDLNSDFLMHFLSTPMFVAHFSPDTTGVSVPHISPDQIASFVIAVPPIDEQRCIVDFLAHETEKLRALSEQAERAIGLLKERRSALIAAAVAGKIDVRGLAAEREAA